MIVLVRLKMDREQIKRLNQELDCIVCFSPTDEELKSYDLNQNNSVIRGVKDDDNQRK